jgi:lipid-binding SYLF domain-containing protein
MTIAIAVGLCSILPAIAGSTSKDRKVLNRAAEVLEVSTNAPDGGIPRDLLEDAECVLVFPNVKKGAFIVGGRYGRGVATCRQANGSMGSPSFFTIGGASVGFQWGGQSADLVLLVMNKDGVGNLLKEQLAIGGEATAAIGPVGRTAQAGTDALLRAQILSWSRSRGLFAGASLDGAVIKPSPDANERLYGKPVSVESTLLRSAPPVPSEATEFVEVASRVSSQDTARK